MKNGRGFLAVTVAFALLTSAVTNAATHEIGPDGDWAAVIAAASPGDTIQVRAGAPSPVNIVIDKRLDIVNYPGEAPAFNGGAAYSAFRFNADADESSVTGLSFQNYSGFALTTYWASPSINVAGCTMDNCGWSFGVTVTVSGCEIKNAAKGGYVIPGSSFTGCTFANLSDQAVAYSNNLSFTDCTFTNVFSVTSGGDGLTMSEVAVDGASFVCGGTSNVTAIGLTLKNISCIAFCGTLNLSVSDSTFQNVERGAYDISGVNFSNITQTGNGSYLVGYCDDVTVENASAENLSYFVGGDNIVVRNSTVKNMTSYGMAFCNNVTTENVTFDGGSMAYAGCTGVNAVRNIIVNHQTGPGEAFYITYGTVTNSTIVGNNVVRAWITDGNLDFDSCIVTANNSFGWGSGTAQYCLMQTGCDVMNLGEGNLIGFLPRFVNAASGDYSLRANSPAIDAGNPTFPVPPEGGARVDIGAVEYDRVADAATPPTISIITPATSDVSPAFVEGTVSVDTTSVTWQNATDSGNAVLTTAGKFWLNVPLSPTGVTALTVTASDGTNTTPAGQEITWNATDLTGRSSSSDSLTIRKDDSLFLTATGTGTALEIDADGDGIFERTGAPGDTFIANYGTAGAFIITAKIDGQVVGSLEVMVVEVDFHGPVACQVGFTRDLGVSVTPANMAPDVAFVSADTNAMSVDLKQYTETGAVLQLDPSSRGTPMVEARLGGTSGPIIVVQEVDEFTLDVPARHCVFVDDDTDIGKSKLIMRPLVLGIIVQFKMGACTSTFRGGVTEFEINSIYFKGELDEATGELVGVLDYQLEVPDTELSYCFNVVLEQPSEFGTDMGEEKSINGDPCRVQVEKIVLCQKTTKSLTIKVTTPGKKATSFVPTIFGGPTGGTPPTFSSTTPVNCIKAQDYVQEVTASDTTTPGSYHVRLAGEAFYQRITVIEWGGVTIASPCNVVFKGKTSTLTGYYCDNGTPKVVPKDKCTWNITAGSDKAKFTGGKITVSGENPVYLDGIDVSSVGEVVVRLDATDIGSTTKSFTVAEVKGVKKGENPSPGTDDKMQLFLPTNPPIPTTLPGTWIGANLLYDLSTDPQGVLDPNPDWVVTETVDMDTWVYETKIDPAVEPLFVQAVVNAQKAAVLAMQQLSTHLGGNDPGKKGFPGFGSLKDNQFSDIQANIMPWVFVRWKVVITTTFSAETPCGKVKVGTSVATYERKGEPVAPTYNVTFSSP